MADSVANGGGLCQGADGAGGGVPVAGDWEEPVVPTETQVVSYGGEEARPQLALSAFKEIGSAIASQSSTPVAARNPIRQERIRVF